MHVTQQEYLAQLSIIIVNEELRAPTKKRFKAIYFMPAKQIMQGKYAVMPHQVHQNDV